MGHPERLRNVLAADPLLLTPEEAAKVLRVGRTTVFALMKAGDLRAIHIGRSCRLSRAELERYVRQLEAPPTAVPPRPRGRKRTTANQHGLFELDGDAVNEAAAVHSPPHASEVEARLDANRPRRRGNT